MKKYKIVKVAAGKKFSMSQPERRKEMKYRRKAVIEAFKYDGDLMGSDGNYYVPGWAVKAYDDGTMYYGQSAGDGHPAELFIKEKGGLYHVSVGDYIIRGIHGELYPCDPAVSATEQPILTMEWKDIEQNIRRQVENGTYMGANEAYLVDEVERGRIANHLFFFFRDGMGEMPEELELKAGNYPDAHARLVELLSTPEEVERIAAHMDHALHQLETGEKSLRFRSVMPKEELRAELDNLLVDKLTFPAAEHADAPAERVSLKAKLEVMKTKVAGGDTEKPMPQKVKGKEETL